MELTDTFQKYVSSHELRSTLASYLDDASSLLSPGDDHHLYDFDPDSLDEDEVRDLKEERLQYTVEYAWNHSPFYRERMEEAGVHPDDITDFEDLEELPVVSSEDIQQNQPPVTSEYRLKSQDPDLDVWRPFNTSGSTGNPKTVFYSFDEEERMYDDVRRGLEHFGVEEGDKAVNYFPFIGLNVSCIGNQGGMKNLNMETVPISNTPLPPDTEAGLLQSHRPDSDEQQYVMLGLPSHIDSKGRELQQTGTDPAMFDIDTIVLAGEPVSESRKEHISETYDADVFEFLGSTESGASAYECTERSGNLHLIEDSVHHEILDPDTHEPADEGDEGELVVTNLLHPGEESGMPLIRYNLGDLVTYQEPDGSCDCAMGGGRLIETPKRDSWSFVFGAVNLDPLYFEDNIFDHPELEDTVEEYQLELDYDTETGQDVLDIKLETEETRTGYDDVQWTEEPQDELEELGNMLLDGHSHLRDTVDTVDAARMNIVPVDEIELGKGKPNRILDNRE